MRKRYIPALIISFAPLSLNANTGAPILLGISLPIFILGFFVILLIEAWFIWRNAKLAFKRALGDSFTVNIATTLLGGIAIPFAVSLIGFTSYIWPSPGLRTLFSHIGTMAHRGHAIPLPSYVFAILWLLATFAITAYLEGRMLKRIWQERSFSPATPAMAISWRSHIYSYSAIGLLYYLGYTLLKH